MKRKGEDWQTAVVALALVVGLVVLIASLRAEAATDWRGSELPPAWGAHEEPQRHRRPKVAPSIEEPAATGEPVTYAGGDVWDALVGCEASGDWGLVTTGNGYWFALQFARGTWLAYGGTEAELEASTAPSPGRLIEVATRVRDAAGGYGPWPHCADLLGLPR